ncbi:MAG: hypothetical protein CV089_21150 [Nitrospira sp. WS110]|nr:hypothetical protein [Nitrospira sp. WS110]
MPLKMTSTLKRNPSTFSRCLSIMLLVATVWSTHGCGDSATINPEVELGSLTINSGTLQPTFASTTTQYSVELSAGVTSVTIAAQPRVAGDTVTIDGQTTTSRTIAVGPSGGPPTVVSIVVSESTTKSRTYTVVLNKASLAGDNDLSGLVVMPGPLTPAFASGQQNYTVDVATDVTTVSVSATKSDPNAVLSGDVPNQGQAIVPLGGPGTTKDVLITVTAQNGNAKTYRITIKRAAPMDNNNLSDLTINAGSLSPPFSPGIVNYSADVPATVDRITVSATKSDPNAVMSAFGSVIAVAGVPTGSVSATVGLGTAVSVPIRVIAPDGTPKTYTVNVFRQSR